MNVPCPSLLLLGVTELLLGTSTELLLGVSALELLLGTVAELLLGAAETDTLPHSAVMPAQALPVPVALPLLTLTARVPVAVGMRPVGVHVRLLVTVVPLQRTVGAVIAVPTVPVATKPVQVKEFALLELGATELLLVAAAMAMLLQVPETLLGLALVPQFAVTVMLV
jgi:hypothetical protein